MKVEIERLQAEQQRLAKLKGAVVRKAEDLDSKRREVEKQRDALRVMTRFV